MAFVIDASAVGSILMFDEDNSLRKTTLTAIANASIHAPVHWPIEIVSILVKAERDGRLDVDEVMPVWQRAEAFIAVALLETVVLARAILDLARAHRLTAQDAAYLELALRLDLPLLTGDKRLARACGSVGVALPFDPRT